MEKITSFRKGRIWLNVWQNEDGEYAVTINKSYQNMNGEWKKTNFLRPDKDDLNNLVLALTEFIEYRENLEPPQKTTLKGWCS